MTDCCNQGYTYFSGRCAYGLTACENQCDQNRYSYRLTPCQSTRGCYCRSDDDATGTYLYCGE